MPAAAGGLDAARCHAATSGWDPVAVPVVRRLKLFFLTYAHTAGHRECSGYRDFETLRESLP